MTSNFTFTMIKPESVLDGHTGPILSKISEAGFRIAALKLTRMTKHQAEVFYEVHKDRPFFGELVEFMTSGPVVAAILEKENAVQAYRNLIGATDPSKAEEGSIRKQFAKSIQSNAVHGSDSDENARVESDFFFSRTERYSDSGESCF